MAGPTHSLGNGVSNGKKVFDRKSLPPSTNPPPFEPHPLIQIRSGRIKSNVFGVQGHQSAIFKTPQPNAVPITKLGITGDEHAYYDHGGVDKALLHYCGPTYDEWKQELPQSEHLFNYGGFGENLISAGMDERVVCIGDIIAVGDEVRVQVSEGRAPCYKLNHRFEVKDMAKRSQMAFRTGWMYRVLQTGKIAPGCTIKLLERKYPEWPVARVQYYLYHELNNIEAMKELVELEPLGHAVKKTFKNRLNKQFENQNARMFGDGTMDMKTWSEYKIVEKSKETSKVISLILETKEEIEEEPVQPGSHVRVKLGGKLVRAYSVVGGTSRRFQLGVALDPESRGGSKFLHEKTKVGDILTVGRITASFPLAEKADKHIIVAGGIGITAFTAALEYLRRSSQSYELHFAVGAEVPFQRYIDPHGSSAKVYNKSAGNTLDLSKVISRSDDNTHIYCCGPQRLMDGVAKAAEDFDMPESNVHFETFQVTTSGDPFTVELAASKKTIEVPSNKTLLDALREVGMEVDSSCEVGNCGTCRVNYCKGRIDHRGTGLMENEKTDTILTCVSRGVGHIVLEL